MGNETRQSKWLRWLEDAARYREDHGDLLIQRDYVTPQGRKLGRWIERQRAAYHGRGSCRLDDKRIRSLEALGMIWELEARPGWDVWIQLCRRYARKTGNLDLRKKEGFEGYALGEWICMQRRRRRRGELSEERIRLLDTLGMVWERNTKYPWMEWYALAKEYRDRCGDLQISPEYCTPDGRKLGSWLCVQRIRYRDKGGRTRRKPLNPRQIQLLEKIGIDWNPGQRAADQGPQRIAP